MYLPAPGTSDAEFEVGQAIYDAIIEAMTAWAHSHIETCAECRANLFSEALTKPHTLMKHLYYAPLTQDYRTQALREQGINIGIKECRDIADQVEQEFMQGYPRYRLTYRPVGHIVESFKFRNRDLLRWFLEDQDWQPAEYLLFALQEDGSYAHIEWND